MRNLIIFLFCSGLLAVVSSCVEKGCTDPRASNFNYAANKNDGSCEYLGCTDPNATNYDPDAQEDNGTCQYLGGARIITSRDSVANDNVILSVFVNNQFIGHIRQKCNQLYPDCEVPCESLSFTQQETGFYTVTYHELQYDATGIDTLFSRTDIALHIQPGKCTLLELK